MTDPHKWDRRFLELAKQISTWSKDPSTQVGAVLVDHGRIIVGMGYNGFPRGIADTEERYNNRPLKYEMVVHAEVNAILAAGYASRGATLYVYPSFGIPCICANCLKAAIQAGVYRIVGYVPDPNDPRVARWADSLALAKTMCDEAGVHYEGIAP